MTRKRSHKQNAAARDLWSQIFTTLARHEMATLQDPNYDPTEDDARFREAMLEAGWSDEDIEQRRRIHELQLAAAPTTSPGVNPHAEWAFGQLCDAVEAAMTRLGLDSHERVARGLEPRLGPYAAKTNVVMTSESIVTVGAQLFRFCGLVARAFTRTLLVSPFLWESNGFTTGAGRRELRRRPDLLIYWVSIYRSYAITGMHVLAPFKPATKEELILFEQVARAMELFAIAHEYGHHHYDHGRVLGEDALREEFEADQFALKLCYEIDERPVLAPNPYLTSGAGGLILLRALKTLRRFEANLDGGEVQTADTHPDVSDRAAKFDTVAFLRPLEFAALKGFRTASLRIMDVVDAEMEVALRVMGPDSLGGHQRLRFE